MAFASSSEFERSFSETSSVEIEDKNGKKFELAWQEVKNITYMKGIKLVRRLGKKTDHLKNEKDVRRFLENLFFRRSDSMLEPPDVLYKLLAENDSQRQELAEVYSNLKDFLAQSAVEKEIRQSLATDLDSDWENKHLRMTENIVKGECPILVAGETSAGKSSFINLLLGVTILPEDFFSCTGIFCTIRYGTRKRVVFKRTGILGSFNESQEVANAEFNLDQDEEEVRKILNEHMNVKLQAREKYDHADLFWPIDILKGNIYIVDSPGIGENKYIDQYSLAYLPKAAGFIFIIKADNAGGVNTRMVQLLKEARAQADGARMRSSNVERTCFNPKAALFVFNHWDRVEANTTHEELETTKRLGLENLENAWPGLDVQQQVFFISVTEANISKSQEAAYPRELCRLLRAIQNLIPLGLKVKLQRHYEWLLDITQTCERQIRIKLAAARDSQEQREIKEKLLTDQLNHLEKSSGKILKELKDRVEKKISETVDILFKHLTSEEAYDKMTDFTDIALPEGDTMEVVNLMAENTIRRQLENELIRWSRETSILENAFRDLNVLVKSKFSLLEDHIKYIEGIFLAEDASTFVRNAVENFSPHRIDRPRISNVQKAAIGATSLIWVPLAVVAVIIILPIFGGLALRQKMLNEKDLENFRKDRTGRMASAMGDFLKQITKDHVRNGLLDSFAKELQNEVSKVDIFIPEWIKANQQKIKDLANDKRTNSEIMKCYNPLLNKLEKITGSLDMFNTHYLRVFDLTMSNFEEKWERRNIIASGSFANVHRCRLKTDTIPEWNKFRKCINGDVAVKVMKDTLTKHNAQDYFREEDILRRLCTSNHSNIVQLFGSLCYQVRSEDEKLILVTELCDTSLRDLIEDNPQLVPGSNRVLCPSLQDKRMAFLFACDMGRQVTEGLRFIHDNNYVHRDLKMENVLVSIRDITPQDKLQISPDVATQPTKIYTAKLCDLGLSKPISQITGTLCGTLLYVPPEVVARKGASSPSDIYSLGLLFWELFHGKRVFEQHSHLDQPEFMEYLRKKKLKLTFPAPEIPKEWKSLCERCSSYEISARPPAHEVISKLNFMSLEESLKIYFRQNF